MVASTNGAAQYSDTLYISDEDGFEVIGASVFEVLPSGKIDSSTQQQTNLDGQVVLQDIGMRSSIYISSIQYHTQTLTIHEVRANHGVVVLAPTMMGEIVVKSQSGYDENLKEVPSKMTIVDKKDIELLNPQNTADVLLQSGDIYVQKSQMGGGSPIIRGFEANKVLMVVDGVRMNNAIYRSGHLQNVITIDNAALERVEVLHGANAVLYGSDALGGVMHFYTKMPRLRGEGQKRVDANAYARYSSASREATGHVDFNIGDEKIAAYTSLTYSAFQDMRAGRLKTSPNMGQYWNRYFYAVRNGDQDSIAVNENPNVQIGTGYSQLDAIQKIRFKPNKNLDFLLNIQYSTSSNVPRYDQLTEGSVDFVNGQITNQTLKFAEWSYGPQQRLLTALTANIKSDSLLLFNTAKTTIAFQKIDEDRITRNFDDPLRRYQQEDVYVFTWNTDLVKQFRNKSKLLYGVQLTHNIVNSSVKTENIETGLVSTRGLGTRYPDGGSTMSTAEVYASYRLKLNERANIIAGTRYAYTALKANFNNQQLYGLPYQEIVTNNSALTGSLALAWDMGQQYQFNAAVASAYRTPNIDDFGKIRAKGSDVTVPNPDLVPEKSVNFEASLGKQFGKKARISGTFFYTLLFDAILQEPYALNGVDTMYYDGDFYDVHANVNAGRASIWGFSGNLYVEFTSNVFMKAGINYTEGRELDLGSEPRPLAHIPPIYGQFDLGFKRKMIETRFNVRFNGEKSLAEYSDDSSENLEKALPEGTPAWFTVNIYASIKFQKHFSMNLGLENLLDWHYRPYGSGVSAPGMNVIVTLRGKF